MNPRWKLKNEVGAALVVALGVLSIMIIIAVMVTALSMNSSKTVGHDTRITEAQNLAEAGVDDVIAVTLANFDEIYPGGYLPDPGYPGDGMPFFAGPQDMTDSGGAVVGSYEAWTKEDPDRPDNILITAEGTMGTETSKVHVSISVASAIFDYALMVGNPDDSYPGGAPGGSCVPSMDLQASSASRVSITGNVHVNGCLDIDAGNNNIGEDASVSLISRDGHNDAVTYSGSNDGEPPAGMQPEPGGEINFPYVDFDAFSNKATVDLGNSPFNMDADDFEAMYGSYDVVEFIADTEAQRNVTLNGSGDVDNPWIVTTTLMLPGQTGNSKPNVKQLEIKGPGISLQPKNGIAILTAEGRVEIWSGSTVGAPGAGALIYVTGQSRNSEFWLDKGAIVYGAVVVSSPRLELHAIGGGGPSDTARDKTVEIVYDSAFLSSLPTGWWSGGTMNAVKENFERDNS